MPTISRTGTTPRRRLLARFRAGAGARAGALAGALVLGVAIGPPAHAAGAGAVSGTASAADEAAPQLKRWIEESAAASWSMSLPGAAGEAAGGGGVRVEVTLGRLNPGLRLAPCARVEPFLPPNARLWGRSHIGVRCVEGASWTTMMPVTVSVFGPALVASLPLPAGSDADPQAFRLEEVDLTRAHGHPVSDAALLERRALARPLAAGQVLRANDLRIRHTVASGDPVRILLLGEGFTISTEGSAMANAGEGQTLRVRTGSGKLLVGTVRDRTVEVKL
ncbi:MAG TPA: flagellar basal body P-ring formation chaperone FlgA [Burkholderiaceae bacterium]|nr:flagellar basal body P-ring formation chaperone FlgA [Burkholderiaceae bacterium]